MASYEPVVLQGGELFSGSTMAISKTPKTEIEVGKKLDEKGETVIATFESNGWYLVCTKSRGALKGHPHCVYGEDVVEVVRFKDQNKKRLEP